MDLRLDEVLETFSAMKITFDIGNVRLDAKRELNERLVSLYSTRGKASWLKKKTTSTDKMIVKYYA